MVMRPWQEAMIKLYMMLLILLSFLPSMAIWHDILFYVNMVSKTLQSSSMCINSSLQQIEGTMEYFDKYKSTGFSACLIIAKELANDENTTIISNKMTY
jgi:hypothetical protein